MVVAFFLCPRGWLGKFFAESVAFFAPKSKLLMRSLSIFNCVGVIQWKKMVVEK